jgi:hypothetical protein
MHQRREAVRQLLGREPQAQVALDLRRAQELERDLAAAPAELEVHLEAAQGMTVHHELDRPIGRDHEQARGLGAVGEERQEIERRVVAPVQVLEDEDERRVARETLERLDELEQHAGARRRPPVRRRR